MEQFVVRIAAEQRARGHDARILALRGGDLLGRCREAGIPCRVIDGRQKALRFLLGANYIAEFRPQIAHAHNFTSLHYATMAKVLSRAAVVVTDHGQGLGFARIPSAREWRKTDRVVAVSNAVRARRRIPPMADKTTVIRNGVLQSSADRDRASIRRELDLNDAFVAIILARVDGMKGHSTLFRAMAALRNRDPEDRPPLRAIVVGDGAARDELEAYAFNLGLGEEDVRFLGFRSNVADLLAASDVFVLPSQSEGLPLSVLEAMSHRLPVIATEVGGIPEIIEDGVNGLLIPVDDPEALADALARMMEYSALRASISELGYWRVRGTFHFGKMVSEYEDLYLQLLSGGR